VGRLRIVLFSDLHCHPFQPYATILANGMNSRLADAISCIDQIVAYCADPNNHVDLVLFGGDLFHVRKNISVAAFNEVYAALSQFAANDIPLVLIHGNHDQASKDGSVNSIKTFHSMAHVIERPGWLELRGRWGDPYSILGVPYTENIEHLKDIVNIPNPEPLAPSILLAHLGVQGAKVGADFVYATPYDAKVEDLNCGAFDRVYLGHYHMHQQLASNAWYIGAPLQHNWGDKHQWRGFLVYNTDTKSHEKVDLKSPKFVEIDNTSLNMDTSLYSDDFVKIVDSSTDSWSKTRIEEERIRLGARSLEIVVREKNSAPFVPRLDISTNTSFKDAMEKYVRSGLSSVEGLDESYLLQIGNEILEEVENGEK